MTPEELLEAYYYKGLNRGEQGEKLIQELLADDVKFRGVFGHRSKRGIVAMLEYTRAIRRALERYTFEIEDMVVAKDDLKASVRLTSRGLHKNTFFGVAGSGHEVHFSSAAFFKFAHDGDKIRISEIYVVGDLDEVKRQIGAPSTSSRAFDAAA